ncbi:hypothetical protein FGIG_00775 [Fasciola gigantica]|uniref:Uncharacterized protein n=1 Tax=Fasciola gigantica TaxID=46835 RepID=A0A504YW76_FASGI|nr:hypothetical protein FGIG_00775 [Fasciola gigantica]
MTVSTINLSRHSSSVNHNTDARHTNHLSDRSSSTNATADALPPLVVTPTSSINSDPCSSHRAGSNLISRGTAHVNSSPISPISSFDEGDEDDLVFLGFSRKVRTSLPSLCLKCGTNESASNCSKCSTIWNPPQRQVRRSDSGAYKRFRVHDTVSPSDSLRASKRLKQQSSRQATADESSKVVDKDNKDASGDVTTDVTQALCERASFVVPASEDLTNSVVPINGSTSTSSTSSLSSLGRHSSRKSPLQPIPTAPLEVVAVSPIGAGIQPADRITVDLFTGEVYVDNRPLRSLIGGMRLTRLIPWREEPSSRVRGGGRRGRVSGCMPSTRRKQGQSTKSVSHAAESRKTVQSHRASNSARGGRSRVSPVCSKTRRNGGSSHPPIRCGTKSRGKLRTRSAGTKKTFPLTTPIVNHNPLPGSTNSVLPRVSRDNLSVTADCVNKGAAVFG